MLQLNPNASVGLVSDLNRLLDPERAHAHTTLRKNKDRLFVAAERLRAAPTDKAVQRAYLAALKTCDLSPKTADAYFGLTHAGGMGRRRLGLSGPRGMKFAISGAGGAAMLTEVFGTYTPNSASAKAPPKAAAVPKAVPTTSSGLVIRIDGYPNLNITTRTSNISTLIDALKDL